MKILNFGSINIDYVYGVPHFVKPAETIASTSYQVFMGGKGCNQSVALAKAGVQVYHAGAIGEDGVWIKNQLNDWGVNVDFLTVSDGPTGHAIIQVEPNGQNAIIIHGGANQSIHSAQIHHVLQNFEKGDILLVQNEINALPELLLAASERGMKIFFNPAPMSASVFELPLETIDVFIINEVEGEELTKRNTAEGILGKMAEQFPNAATLLTLGEKGARYQHASEMKSINAKKVKAIDTTAAGDTFIGYFLANWALGETLDTCLQKATQASAICVTRAGGAVSIPSKEEVM
ncbi:ribokinase [Runella sp. SP2]|uniref:ribokinase n=1 Tax=Runella sp. SP2 TaxID=2268026 RepID=UPI000F07C950|nr:ribokinase [Runella sp. SP2]AYQ32123.1 ribokinase [Runella sp. SP2]